MYFVRCECRCEEEWMLTVRDTKRMVQISGTGARPRNRLRNIGRGGRGEQGDTVSTVLMSASRMQVFLVEEIHLAREVRPIRATRKFPVQAFHVTCSTLVRELHLPTTEIV